MKPTTHALLLCCALLLGACGSDSEYSDDSPNEADASDLDQRDLTTDAPSPGDAADISTPDLTEADSDDLASDAPDAPELPPALPCLRVEPAGAIDFGAAPIGGVKALPVLLQSCSARQPLVVQEITLLEGSDEDFFLSEVPDLPRSIPPGEAVTLLFNYAPSSEGPHRATLQIGSDDPQQPQAQLAARGQGDNNACPTAVARGRVQRDPPQPFATTLSALPLQTIQLDAGDSSDPDRADTISRYEWAIIEKPADSTTRMAPRDSVVRPSLFLDLAGRYVVELTVYDQRRLGSCRPARVTIDAVPGGGIHYQLTWDTDGTDVDLHFLNPQGRWNASPWDLYYLNRAPNWGSPVRSEDDPSLDLDDVDGFGPEIASLDEPEEVAYRLGAFYFADRGAGASRVTARVFLNSVLSFEYPNKEMTNNQFWEIATLQWGDAPTFTTIDRLTDGFPP